MSYFPHQPSALTWLVGSGEGWGLATTLSSTTGEKQCLLGVTWGLSSRSLQAL